MDPWISMQLNLIFLLAENIAEGTEPTSEEWDRYFKAPINALMISAGVL
jgi:hypothetical protein